MPSGAKKVFLTKLTDTSTLDKEGVGTLRWEGNKCYKWVLYNNGAGSVAAVAGNIVFYYALSGDGVSGGYENNEVTADVTDSGGIAAGVLQAVIADGSYGWIQIKGPATLTTALTAGSDGNALTAIGAGDSTMDVSGLVTDAVVAYATDASAKKVALECPF